MEVPAPQLQSELSSLHEKYSSIPVLCVLNPLKHSLSSDAYRYRSSHSSLQSAVDYIKQLYETMVNELQKVFDDADKDHNCEIDDDEMLTLIQEMGFEATQEQAT
jgi:hypothetical protein